MTTPTRIQLSRRKGWRMPPNCVKVDRSTKWGNPFIVGVHGNREECLGLFRYLCAGYTTFSLGLDCIDAQERFSAHAKQNIEKLKGKDLACWCKPGVPCHADFLLMLVNGKKFRAQGS